MNLYLISLAISVISVIISFLDNKFNSRNRNNSDYIKLFFIILTISGGGTYLYEYLMNDESSITDIKQIIDVNIGGDGGGNGVVGGNGDVSGNGGVSAVSSVGGGEEIELGDVIDTDVIDTGMPDF